MTIEHLIPASATKTGFGSAADFERFEELRDRLWNFALLERGLNKKAGSMPFAKKKHLYVESAFPMTRELADRSGFGVDDAEKRSIELASLAVQAWKR